MVVLDIFWHLPIKSDLTWKNVQNEKGVVFETRCRLIANEMKTVKIGSLKLLTQQKKF